MSNNTINQQTLFWNNTAGASTGPTYDLVYDGKAYVQTCSGCEMPVTWHTRCMDKACFAYLNKIKKEPQIVLKLTRFKWWSW